MLRQEHFTSLVSQPSAYHLPATRRIVVRANLISLRSVQRGHLVIQVKTKSWILMTEGDVGKQTVTKPQRIDRGLHTSSGANNIEFGKIFNH